MRRSLRLEMNITLLRSWQQYRHKRGKINTTNRRMWLRNGRRSGKNIITYSSNRKTTMKMCCTNPETFTTIFTLFDDNTIGVEIGITNILTLHHMKWVGIKTMSEKAEQKLFDSLAESNARARATKKNRSSQSRRDLLGERFANEKSWAAVDANAEVAELLLA